MQIRGLTTNCNDRTLSSVTRIIRTNNIYPQKILTSTEEVIDMDKQCNAMNNCYDNNNCDEEQKTYYCCEDTCCDSCCCVPKKCKCLCDLVTAPLWLIILISSIVALAFLAILLVFIIFLSMNSFFKTPSNINNNCTNYGIYNPDYQKCDCLDSTYGNSCEYCNFCENFSFILRCVF